MQQKSTEKVRKPKKPSFIFGEKVARNYECMYYKRWMFL